MFTVRSYRDEQLGPGHRGGLYGRLLRADGTTHRTLFSVGLPSEDARIFTIIAPIPGVNSTVLRELDATARAALASIATKTGLPQ